LLGVGLVRDRGVVQEVVVGSGGVESVGEAITFAYPEGDLPALSASLAGAIRKGRWRHRRVAVALGSLWCDHWICDLPPVKVRHLPLLVQREVVARIGEGALPTWGYEVCAADAGGPCTVVVTSADAAVVAAIEAGILAARCTPVCATTTQVAGLARLRQPDQLAGLGVVAQIILGPHETDFVVFDEGRLLFSRTLMRGIEPDDDPDGRSEPSEQERAQLERLAVEIQRSVLYVKREIRHPIELAIMGGVPRTWEWVKASMRELIELPMGWETLPLDQAVAGRCEESLRLLARGAALATLLPATLDLFPQRSVDERHPYAGVAVVASTLLLWAAAGVTAGFHLHDLGTRLAEDGRARAAAVTRRQSFAARVEPDYGRLTAARGEIDRFLAVINRYGTGPRAAWLLTLLSHTVGPDTVLLNCHLERTADGWQCLVDGALTAPSREAAAAAYEALLKRIETMPGVGLQLSSRKRVPPDLGHRGPLEVTGSTYPFELHLRLGPGGTV